MKYFSTNGDNVLMNVTDVYAALTIDVIAADHSTIPKNLYPIIPAPSLNAEAGGLVGSSFTPLATTPSIARNRSTLITDAMIIPITEFFVIWPTFSSPVVPASISLCPARQMLCSLLPSHLLML